MPRKRWLIALATLVVLLVAIELAVRRWERPKACVQIINGGQAPMEGVAVVFGDTRMGAAPIAVGQSAQLWMTVGPAGPLQLEFRQKNNALSGFTIADYDPAQNAADGFKLVLVVGNNQVQRYVEDDDTHKDQRSLWEKFLDWIQSDTEPAS